MLKNHYFDVVQWREFIPLNEFLQLISKPGIFHGIRHVAISSVLKIKRKNVLFTIEWE